MDFNYRKIYDISMPVSWDMPVYKGKEENRPQLLTDRDFNSGNAYESKIIMKLHTGTHLDQPLHMIPEGNSIEKLEIKKVITPCRVIDLSYLDEKINIKDIERKNITEGEFILFKTRNSSVNIIEQDFVYLDRTAARYLAEQNVKGVGIDSLGIERNQPEHETHILLLKSGIPILEGLRLNEVQEGEYFLFAVPVNIVGAEAAPVRAILMK